MGLWQHSKRQAAQQAAVRTQVKEVRSQGRSVQPRQRCRLPRLTHFFNQRVKTAWPAGREQQQEQRGVAKG